VAERSENARFIKAWALAPTGIVDVQDLNGSCNGALRLEHRVRDAGRHREVIVYLVTSAQRGGGHPGGDGQGAGAMHQRQLHHLQQEQPPPEMFYPSFGHRLEQHPYPSHQPSGCFAGEGGELARHLSMHSGGMYGEAMHIEPFAAPSMEGGPRLRRCATSYTPQASMIPRVAPLMRRPFRHQSAPPAYCAAGGAADLRSSGGMMHRGLPSWARPSRFSLD
jgi:hypothetical protein